MNQIIKFPSLGMTIDTSKDSKEKVAALVAQYPEVRRAFARIEAAKLSKPASDVKEIK